MKRPVYKPYWVHAPDAAEMLELDKNYFSVNYSLKKPKWIKKTERGEIYADVGYMRYFYDLKSYYWNLAHEYYFFFKENGFKDADLVRAMLKNCGGIKGSWEGFFSCDMFRLTQKERNMKAISIMITKFIGWCDKNIPKIVAVGKARGYKIIR